MSKNRPSILMPFSPLDALLNARPAMWKAAKPRPGDGPIECDMRVADVLRPIVKRIQDEAVAAHVRQTSRGALGDAEGGN